MFTVSNSMDQLFSWFYYGALSALTDFEQYMGNMGVEVFNNVYAQALVQFFSLLGNALLIVGCVVAFAEYAVDCQNGGGNIKNTGMNILKGFCAAELFTIIPVQLFAFSVQMETTIATIFNYAGLKTDIVPKQASGSSTMANLIQGPLSFFTTLVQNDPVLSVIGSIAGAVTGSGQQHVPTFASLLFLIVFLVSFLKVLLDNLKRGAILLVQICVCSLYMFSIPRGYTDGFISWCKQVAGLCFTTFLQNLFLIIGLSAMKGSLVFGLGIMLGAAEIPRIAQGFGLETGLKANITSISMATSSFVNLGRTLAKAAV